MLNIIEAIAEAKGFGTEEIKGFALDEIGTAVSAVQEANGFSEEPFGFYTEDFEDDSCGDWNQPPQEEPIWDTDEEIDVYEPFGGIEGYIAYIM